MFSFMELNRLPSVSVIVPNYNHAPFLKQRIESILSQTFQDFELILLDDCSTDDSRGIIENYRNDPHVTHIVYNEVNNGSPFAQWDKGIALAKGTWIWIAESDDWSAPDFLGTMMHGLESHPECGIGYTLATYVYNDSDWCPMETEETLVYNGKEFNINHLLFRNEIYNVSMTVFQKKLYEKIDVSLFKGMCYCHDWLLYAQLCRYTSVLFVRESHSFFRQHESNTSLKAEQQGKLFIEGYDVLKYIVAAYGLGGASYARHWGRLLAKKEKECRFSPRVTQSIHSRTVKEFPMVYLWYILYKLRLGMWTKTMCP